jgi:AcrR family transcriptional regulator
VAVRSRSRQQERSEHTRARLMAATVDCLVERGWAGTTTTVVAERAGVSRGAQLHHFPTRGALVIAAVEHLARARSEEIRAEAATLPPGPGRTQAVLAMLARLYTGPLFHAALELWVAARTDPELRATVMTLDAQFGRVAHRLTVELLRAEESKPGVRETVQTTLDLIRGLGLANVLTDDAPRRRILLAAWADTLDARLAESRGRPS